MQRAVVNKEVLNCDLDRVRTSIASTHTGLKPTNLKIIEDKYINVLRKLKYSPKKFEIVDIALKIVNRDGILFQNDIHPIRYELLFTVLFWL